MSDSYQHDPHARLDYQFDWSRWLDDDETITLAEVAEVAELTIETPIVATGRVVVWVSGGTVGQMYRVTCHITTSAGREDDRTMLLKVVNR